MFLSSFGPNGRYLPVLHIDLLASRLEDLMPVNMSVSELPVTVLYSPISFGKLRLWIQFTGALHTLKLMGFTNKDIDELKGIFADTNIILLCGTFVVAALHVSITLSLFFCGSYKISLRFLNFPVGKDFKTSKIFLSSLANLFCLGRLWDIVA